jgi:hypothetical protein
MERRSRETVSIRLPDTDRRSLWSAQTRSARARGGRVARSAGKPRFAPHTHARLRLRHPRGFPLIVIELDIGRAVVTIGDKDAELLRDIAAAQAGRSAASRDLSLLLNQALTSRRRIALQRSEVKALRQIITADRRLNRLVTTFDQAVTDPQAS